MEKTDNRILLRLRRNHFFQNSISYCQNHFLGQRFGTQFFDIEEIEFSGINYKKIEEKMSMSTEFAKKLTRICRAQNEAEIKEILSDQNFEVRGLRENLEKKEQDLNNANSRIDELSTTIVDLQNQLENERKMRDEQKKGSDDSTKNLKRKADKDIEEEKTSKKRRIE